MAKERTRSGQRYVGQNMKKLLMFGLADLATAVQAIEHPKNHWYHKGLQALGLAARWPLRADIQHFFREILL